MKQLQHKNTDPKEVHAERHAQQVNNIINHRWAAALNLYWLSFLLYAVQLDVAQ